MRQVDYLAEASAVHHRIENHQDKSQQRKEAEEGGCRHRHDFPPETCNQPGSDNSLRQGEQKSHRFRGKPEEIQMEELIVVGHHKSGTHRVQQLEYP